MKLITTDAQLRNYLPNVIQTVKGELPFIERLSLFLDLAEDWVKENFTGEKIFDDVCDGTLSTLRSPLSTLVVADALRRAIPSLDIVLTPNGFGVINTSNLAPASKPRVDRLVGSMLAHRDDCIATLLEGLRGVESWLSTPQASFFGATLFPDFSIIEATGPIQSSKWERYQQLRPQVIDLEASLAEEWISPELMSVLRYANLRNTLTRPQSEITARIKSQIILCLKGAPLNARSLADIVNHIRKNPDLFPQWHRSATAELFSPPVFRNRKDSRGYFF